MHWVLATILGPCGVLQHTVCCFAGPLQLPMGTVMPWGGGGHSALGTILCTTFLFWSVLQHTFSTGRRRNWQAEGADRAAKEINAPAADGALRAGPASGLPAVPADAVAPAAPKPSAAAAASRRIWEIRTETSSFAEERPGGASPGDNLNMLPAELGARNSTGITFGVDR